MNFSKKLITFFTNLGFEILFLILKLIIIGILFFIFYFIANKTRKSIRKYKSEKIPQELITFLSDFIFFTILIIGFILTLSLIGINTNAIWASLGLGGFALGFALKDMISNFISGLMIILTKTYKIGDEITVNNFTGKVKSINLRYTVLIPIGTNESQEKQESEEKIILVPNNIIFSNISVIKKTSLK